MFLLSVFSPDPNLHCGWSLLSTMVQTISVFGKESGEQDRNLGHFEMSTNLETPGLSGATSTHCETVNKGSKKKKKKKKKYYEADDTMFTETSKLPTPEGAA